MSFQHNKAMQPKTTKNATCTRGRRTLKQLPRMTTATTSRSRNHDIPCCKLRMLRYVAKRQAATTHKEPWTEAVGSKDASHGFISFRHLD